MKKKITKNDFQKIKLLVLDFDGVLTDNKVYVDEEGREIVCCSRADSLGLEEVKKSGVRVSAISKEKNKVVRARCSKLKIMALQGANDKAEILKGLLKKLKIKPHQACYLGNDINDVGCLKMVGVGCAVKNAHILARKSARYVTKNTGGNGAVREICDLILGAG